MDLCHLFPQLLDSYRDGHGVVDLHHCPFSGRIIACGNRTFPLTPQYVKNILNRLDRSQGFFGTIYEVTEECDQSDEAESHIQMTLLSAAAVSAPAMPTEAPMARPASPQAITTQPPPQAALREEFEEELEQLDPLQLFSSDNNMSESEIAKAVVAENRKYVYHGEVSPANLHI